MTKFLRELFINGGGSHCDFFLLLNVASRGDSGVVRILAILLERALICSFLRVNSVLTHSYCFVCKIFLGGLIVCYVLVGYCACAAIQGNCDTDGKLPVFLTEIQPNSVVERFPEMRTVGRWGR